MTHIYAILEVDETTYDEIAEKLHAAGYGHAIHDAGGNDGIVINMHGVALSRARSPRRRKGIQMQIAELMRSEIDRVIAPRETP
jgi:hypothetical protein